MISKLLVEGLNSYKVQITYSDGHTEQKDMDTDALVQLMQTLQLPHYDVSEMLHYIFTTVKKYSVTKISMYLNLGKYPVFIVYFYMQYGDVKITTKIEDAKYVSYCIMYMDHTKQKVFKDMDLPTLRTMFLTLYSELDAVIADVEYVNNTFETAHMDKEYAQFYNAVTKNAQRYGDIVQYNYGDYKIVEDHEGVTLFKKNAKINRFENVDSAIRFLYALTHKHAENSKIAAYSITSSNNEYILSVEYTNGYRSSRSMNMQQLKNAIQSMHIKTKYDVFYILERFRVYGAHVYVFVNSAGNISVTATIKIDGATAKVLIKYRNDLKYSITYADKTIEKEYAAGTVPNEERLMNEIDRELQKLKAPEKKLKYAGKRHADVQRFFEYMKSAGMQKIQNVTMQILKQKVTVFGNETVEDKTVHCDEIIFNVKNSVLYVYCVMKCRHIPEYSISVLPNRIVLEGRTLKIIVYEKNFTKMYIYRW